jgi:hypothetical protein
MYNFYELNVIGIQNVLNNNENKTREKKNHKSVKSKIKKSNYLFEE